MSIFDKIKSGESEEVKKMLAEDPSLAEKKDTKGFPLSCWQVTAINWRSQNC